MLLSDASKSLVAIKFKKEKNQKTSFEGGLISSHYLFSEYSVNPSNDDVDDDNNDDDDGNNNDYNNDDANNNDDNNIGGNMRDGNMMIKTTNRIATVRLQQHQLLKQHQQHQQQRH